MEDGRQALLSGGRATLGSLGPTAATLGLHFAVAATPAWAVAPIVLETHAWRPFSSRDLRMLMGTWGVLAGAPAAACALLAVAGAGLLRRRSAAWLTGSAAIVAAIASAVAVVVAAAGGAAWTAAGTALAALLLVPAAATTTVVSRAMRARAAALA